jgi:hypothetical protein
MSDEDTCPRCRSTVPSGDNTCPECGLDPQRKLFQFGLGLAIVGGGTLWFSVLIGAVLVVLGTGLAVASQLGPTVWM